MNDAINWLLAAMVVLYLLLLPSIAGGEVCGTIPCSATWAAETPHPTAPPPPVTWSVYLPIVR